MAALNFPTTGLVAGVTQYSANGTTYLWDGVKWVGRTAGGAAGTNSLQNNGHTVQVNADGNLVLPAFSMPNTVGTTGQILKWPASGSTLAWANDNNSGGSGPSIGNFSFNNDTMVIPVHGGGSEAYLKAGGDRPNSVQLRTAVNYVNTDINTSEIALEAGNGGISAQVYGHWTGGADGAGGPTLVYAGVENVSGEHGPGFAGMVAIDPGVTSQYAVSVNEDGKIFLNLGEPVTTTQYTAALGVLTTNIDPESGFAQLNGILVNPDDTVINGRSKITMNTDRGTVLFGNQPETIGDPSHFHIMKLNAAATDLFFGDDFNYVKLPGNYDGVVNDYGVEIGTSGSKVWRFDPTGNLTLPEVSFGLSGSPSVGPTIYFPVIESGTPVAGGGLGAVANGANGSFVGMALTSNDYSWKFDVTGKLTLPGGGIVGDTLGDGGLTVQSPAESYVELGSFDGNAYVWVADTGYYHDASRANAAVYISTDYQNADHRWAFDHTGNLVLPAGGDILNSSGQSVLGGGGGNGTANRVQFTNAGSIYQADDAEPGRYNIVINAEKDIVFGTDEEGQEFRFTSTGNIKLPRGGSIGNQDTSVDIELDGGSTNPYWYNLFGDTGASYHANAAINGSVVHDSGGNVFVLGSAIGFYNSFSSNNLFLKYSPEGRLLWRRTWTDNNGEPCGSYNASLRYIAANVELGTQDTILWAAQVPFNNISYVGTMDTDGNLVDQFGNVKLPTRLDNFAATDLEWVGTDDQATIAYVVGQVHIPGPNLHFPTVLGLNLNDATAYGDSMIAPAGIDPTAGIGSGRVPWANMYKALTVVSVSGSLLIPTVGTYYDGSFSHAILTVATNGPPVTYGVGAANLPEDDIIGEDLCCDANGNVYVIVNNISTNYSVLVKANSANLAAHTSAWQLVLGTPHSGPGDDFYASAVAYDNGFVYVLGEYYDAGTDDTDAMLIKIGSANGDIVWTRRIHSARDDGVIFGAPGWSSSSGISVYDDHVAISYYTTDRTPVFNGGPQSNTVTLQYPLDGGLLGGFGDFLITDFDPGHGSGNYAITTLTTSLNEISITSGFASLQATTVTVGTGWTNTQWDMLLNRQVYDPQTWRFNYDGTFDTAAITHEGEVRITARVAPAIQEPTPSTWAFQNNDGLRFPDGSVQYGAYVETEMALDGGFAGSAYNVVPRPTIADGGGSSSRHGVSDPVYDGSSGENYVLDGGGA